MTSVRVCVCEEVLGTPEMKGAPSLYFTLRLYYHVEKRHIRSFTERTEIWGKRRWNQTSMRGLDAELKTLESFSVI